MITLLFIACVSRPAPEAPAPVPVTPDCAQLPVGAPDGAGYYVAQGFGTNDHLGEDWNGTGGGNTDLGDPVHAIAEGVVAEAVDHRGGWGRVVRVVHRLEAAGGPVDAESLYAHLDTMAVKRGDRVERGQALGTIGTAHGVYPAHLHLEVRTKPGLPLGGGYSADRTGFVAPRTFIAAHRSGC